MNEEFETFESEIEYSKLRNAVVAIPSNIEEVHINIAEDKLVLSAIDLARVLFAKCTLKPDAFESYNSTGQFETYIDIRKLRNFVLVGLTSKDDAQVRLTIDENTQRLTITSKYYTYSIALFSSLHSKPPNLPDFSFDSVVAIPSNVLKQYIMALNKNESHEIALSLSTKSLRLQTHHDDDVLEIVIPTDELVLNNDELKEVESKYDLDYLTNIVKSTQFASDTELHLLTNSPIKMIAKNDGVESEYYLAPRIEND